MAIKESQFSPDLTALPDGIFERLRAKYQELMQHDISSGRRARQEELFASIVTKARQVGVWDNMWAYGGISITPETGVLGDDFERPHKDIEWIVAGKNNLIDLARACGLKERRSVLMRGTPLHLYTDPSTGLLVEFRNINVIPNAEDKGAYPYSKPFWMHPIMPRPLGLPVSALYPTSIVCWGDVECQRVCPELTYLSKCESDAEKDQYDAGRLRRSGKLDLARMQRIRDDVRRANMNIVVPPTIAHFIRSQDRGMIEGQPTAQGLSGTVWQMNSN